MAPLRVAFELCSASRWLFVALMVLLLGLVVGQPVLIPNVVPHYTQNDPQWASDRMGNDGALFGKATLTLGNSQ